MHDSIKWQNCYFDRKKPAYFPLIGSNFFQIGFVFFVYFRLWLDEIGHEYDADLSIRNWKNLRIDKIFEQNGIWISK